MNRVYELDLDIFERFPEPDDIESFNIYKEFIIECYNSRENSYFQYSDFHHVLPVCLGGTDDLNRIFLTYKEHYLAHYYLAKSYYLNYGLLFTINMMSSVGKYTSIDEYADKYSESKKLYIDHMRVKMSGDGNPMRNPEVSAKFVGDNNHMRRSASIRAKFSQMNSARSDYFAEVSRQSKIGRVWVNNGSEMKQIYPEDLEAYLSIGYVRGMLKSTDSKSKDFDCVCKVCGKSYKGGKYSRLCPDHLKEVCSNKVYNNRR